MARLTGHTLKACSLPKSKEKHFKQAIISNIMFNFLKKFFKEEKVIKELSFDEFLKWFDEFEKEAEKRISDKIESLNEKIKENIKKVESKLEKLDTTKLANPNIPDRVKHILLGNKESHIIKMRNFLDEIEFPKNLDDLEHLKERFNEKLENLTKSTQKTNMVLQEFLANEAKDVAVSVRNIKIDLEDMLDEIITLNFNLVREIKDLITNIKNSDKAKEELNKNIKEGKDKKTSLDNILKETEKAVNKLKNSPEFKKLKIILEDIFKKKGKKTNIEKELIHIFSIMEKSLKKFQHITLDEETVKKYIKDPVKSLLEDDESKLREVLSNMKKAILKGSIQLKESKKHKTISIIGSITEDFLNKFKKSHISIKDEIEAIEEKIKEFSIENEIEELENKITETKAKLDVLIHELENQKNKVENINKDTITKKIMEKLESLGEKIVIQ